MRRGFLDKVMDRLAKVDPQNLQVHFLRLARERGLLEAVFQAIQEGIIVLDSQGRVSYLNRAAEKMLGIQQGSAVGRPIARYLSDIDWDRILKLDPGEWSKIISQDLDVSYPQRRLLNFYLVPLTAATDEDKGLLVMLRDITGQRESQENMLESERINAIQVLAAGVAHEIGNPLNALSIHLQLIDRALARVREEDQARIREPLQVARKEVARLDTIITQFLRAIRPVRPKLSLARVDRILQDTLALLKQEIENRSIDVEITSPADLPRVYVDRQQIKQAFFNVVKNAFEAMPDGGALTIELTASDRFLAIAFRDTGAGIKQEEFGRIFEPFQTTKTDGTGLGLMIVQRIVHDHGGSIEVHSEPDIGTVVTIILPLAEPRTRLLKSRSIPVEEAS